MKVLLLVKEICELEDGFEIVDGAIDQRYLEYDLNEWDDYAIEEGVRLQEAGIAEEVIAVTIGPGRSEETLRMALAKGADRAIRVWDDVLDETDLLDVGTKTRLLAAIVREEEPDLVLSGVQAGDDAFRATGVSLASEVGFGWAAVINHLDHDSLAEGTATVRRELEGGVSELTDVALPAVLTIQTGINEPRYASMRSIRQAQRKPVAAKTLADLGLSAEDVAGDLRLAAMSEPEAESEATIWEGDPADTAGQLAAFLRETGVVAE